MGQDNKPNPIESSANLPSLSVPVSLNLQIPGSSSTSLSTSVRPTEHGVISQLDTEPNRENIDPLPSTSAVLPVSANQPVKSTPRMNRRIPTRRSQIAPVGTPVEVIISYFDTAAKIYIRYCCYEVKLQEMMKEIQILGPQAEPIDTSNLKNNLKCLLYRKNENIWYRIRIINTAKNERILCQSLDYGRFHSISIRNKDSFWKMKESLNLIPPFAICVEMSGVDIKKSKIANAEKQKLSNEKYLMDIVREGNVKLVRLKTLGGEDLALKLSEIRFENHRR